ncbi:MAG TPA: 2-oxoacid:acceptor oxidoreductase family protein [Candidatus Binatia bacterium]|jgi:2-oxoglutarate ferredoxin oxidoreductase subunit gamma|nr:2-oxoacid:acceptor oxidoreductase family protein [Candidatus Binatia bacterium]
MADPYKIVVCGEGGQGALSIAKIIAYAAWLQGKQAVYVPYFSTEKRGGVSMAFAQIGDEPIPFPKFSKADLWVVMSQRSIDRIYDFLQPGTKVIVNSFLVKDVSRIAAWDPQQIDASTIAKTQLKKPRTFNMIIMGAMLRYIPGMDKESFGKALEKQFKSKYDKDPSLKTLNEKAFNIGYDLTK